MAAVWVADIRKKGVADATKLGVADATKMGAANARVAYLLPPIIIPISLWNITTLHMKNHPLPTCGDSNWLGEWAEGWLEVVDAFLWLWQWLSLKWDFFCRLFLIGIFLWFGCYHDFVGAFLMAADIMVAIFSSPAVGRVMFNSSMVATVAGSRPSTSTSCSSSTVKKTISITKIITIIAVVNTINIIVNLKHGHLLCLDLCLFSPSPPLSPLIVVQLFSITELFKTSCLDFF